MAIKGKVASFAHLLGISAKAEEEDDKKRDDETDEEYAKRMEEDDEAKKAKEEEDSDKDGMKAEEKEKEEEDPDSAKKAKKAEEEDDEKEKAARKSERARCRAIFSAKSAGSRPDMAAHLAFDTDMDAKAAVKLLDVAAVGNVIRPGLAHRMAAVVLPKIGDDADNSSASGPQGIAAKIIAAGKKRRGEI